MSLVRQLIKDRPTDWLQHLQEHYKIDVARDQHLVSLKYNQFESPMHEPIVQECRGMVVDIERNEIVAWPYNKFWNHGEALAASIDWSTANVQEKLDGSLMILFWDPRLESWNVASSGTPMAGGNFGSDSTRTFREAFLEAWSKLGMLFPTNPIDRAYCFMFEFCATENRIIVKHDQPRIVLHGARDIEDGFELQPALFTLANDYNWELVKSYPIGSIEECLQAAAALDPLQQEGFVVVDANHNRVKIKSPRYVALHHLKGEMSVRRAIELWVSGEASELLANFPEMAADIDPIHAALDRAALAATDVFYANIAAPTRKDFAAGVKASPYQAIVFRLYSEREAALKAGDNEPLDAFDAKGIMRSMNISALERWVEIDRE